MIDNYLWGKVDRISPEAPVPVVKMEKEENRLGGAANVALNLKALGAATSLVSIIGDDQYGKKGFKLLKKRSLSDEIIISGFRKTTVKKRVLSGNHQMIRIDEEDDSEIDEDLANCLIAVVEQEFLRDPPDALVFQDYDKGLLNKYVIEKIIEICKRYKTPVIADPKHRNFFHYKNIDLLKPNLRELESALNSGSISQNETGISAALDDLDSRLDCETSIQL